MLRGWDADRDGAGRGAGGGAAGGGQGSCGWHGPLPPAPSRKGRGSTHILPLPLREGAGGRGPCRPTDHLAWVPNRGLLAASVAAQSLAGADPDGCVRARTATPGFVAVTGPCGVRG